MTYKEKLEQDHPDCVDDLCGGGCVGCPSDYGWPDMPGCTDKCNTDQVCTICWNREIPDTEKYPSLQEAMEKIQECVIKDSGSRQEFSTGAVRDIQKGKGRCDLMPLDVVVNVGQCWDQWHKDILLLIYKFQQSGCTGYLDSVLTCFGSHAFSDPQTLLLEVAKHFEDGAEKYGENNWQKGLPVKCYINSAVRHYLKWLRGDKDEPHDRAFCWNILCAIWTCKHKPELNDYRQTKNENTCVCCGASIPEGWQYCNTCWENENGGG